MTHSLTIRLGDRADLAWSQRVVTESHYLRSPVDSRARPMVYVIDYDALLLLDCQRAIKDARTEAARYAATVGGLPVSVSP